MTVARWLETDSLSNQNIASAAAIGAYTADADRMIVCDVSLGSVAGNGDYVIYLTRQINGAGSAYVMLPKTTCTAASGETALAMQSGMISVRSGDVLTCYVDGLAGDTTTPDTVVRWFEMDALQPTTAGRTLAVDASGNASATLAATQGAVTFGQVKILADASLEGALHVVNSNALGYGQYNEGGYAGERNEGGTLGQRNTGGATGQYNEGGTNYGQLNSGVTGQSNEGTATGQNNSGTSGYGIQATGGTGQTSPDFAATGGGLTAQETADALLLAPSGAAASGSAMDVLADIPADVWAYVTRTLTEGSTTTTDATAAGSITRKRGNSWSISLTLGAITGYTSLWFTIKRSYDDPDSAAILQIKLNATTTDDDLLTVNGAAATSAALGTITVSDASTGAIVVAVDETVTDDLPVGVFYYDAQALISGNVTTPEAGTFTISADVTRAVA